MEHQFITGLEELFYNPETKTTHLRGWGSEKETKSALIPAPELPVVSFTPQARWDINRQLEYHDGSLLGFVLVLDGDWRDRVDEILFQAEDDEIDTDYLTALNHQKPNFAGRAQALLNKATAKAASLMPAKPAEEEAEEEHVHHEEGPLISIVTPVYNIEEGYFRDFLDSVLNQTYPNWELCMADDCSTEPHVREILEEYKAKDDRVKVVYREENGHIARATNSAIGLATGDFIAFMDDDDVLPSYALDEMVDAALANPEADIIYSDENKLNDNGDFYDPYYKPDWDPILFNSANYLNHLTMMRREILDMDHLLDPDYNGSQDYEFLQRMIPQAREIVHVPKILYHWRAVEGSVAENPEAKLYAYDAARRAIADAIEREGVNASVTFGKDLGSYDVVYEPDQKPSVALIIVSETLRDSDLRSLDALELLAHTDYDNFEMIMVNTEWFTDDPRVRYIYDSAARTKSGLRNYAARKTDADILVFLDEDIRPKKDDWLTELLGQIRNPAVGIVGPKIIDQKYNVVGAGVTIYEGKRYLPYYGMFASDGGYYNRLKHDQQVLAVSLDCLAVKHDAFNEAGGFKPDYEDFEADIALSEDLRRQGLMTEIVPKVVMIKDSQNTTQYADLTRLIRDYGLEHYVDPFINPNIGFAGRDDRPIQY